MVIREQQRFSFNEVRQVLGGVLEHDLHAKRVASLCDATLGVLRSASLAVCMIGQGLAAARGLNPKHATKQVDRLLSNPKINVDDILVRWVPYVIGARSSIVVALDWTDFDADNQATIMVSLITDHGRATPLVWLTVDTRTLKHNRSLYEHRVLVRLAELLPADIKVCVVADRGFGDQKLYRVLTEELCFGYVIRFRGNIAVTAKDLTGYYGRCWGIECGLRDTKDLRFGMGMGAMHVNSPERRDRLWLINAFAVVLLTLLGAAGETLGYDRMLKTNTAKHRIHSLFRQGCMLYDLIPMMPEARLRPLMQCFSRMLQDQPIFADVFGAV
jgi:hypothetical protein